MRARLYPETVEKSFILAKVIELFGFVAYPDMDFSDCTPNKLFQNREAGLPFATFTERMFNKWKSFKLSAGKLQFRFVPYESYIMTEILG